MITTIKVIKYQNNEVISVDKYLEPILVLTKEECEAFTRCPFSDGHVNEHNYPNYNEVINKIYDFARN
jgi:hypothetical protein